MEGEKRQRTHKDLWALARRQHGVVTRQQLLAQGHSKKWIEHRVARGRLHRIYDGVFAVGRPALTQHGRWMAAVLSCGPQAVLSHESAAALWSIRRSRSSRIDVSLPSDTGRRARRGIVLHRRPTLRELDATRHYGIPVTTPICTLIDLATCLEGDPLEAAVNEADKLGLTHPEKLRSALTQLVRRPGVRRLREVLDRHTFVLTDSELERCFLPLARAAGLDTPQTGVEVNGFKVDFYWPDLGLVVETDGLRYHRTPTQQAKDRLRDQTHTAKGLTPLRFTHGQVRFERERVIATLAEVATCANITRPTNRRPRRPAATGIRPTQAER
jgi:very-short-patch-repair endonuclease/predicted transcriptional regulator of viral defense system